MFKTKLSRLNQSGVAHLLYPILGLVVVAVIAGAGFYVYEQNKSGAGTKNVTYRVSAYALSPAPINGVNPVEKCRDKYAAPYDNGAQRTACIGVAKPSKANLYASFGYYYKEGEKSRGFTPTLKCNGIKVREGKAGDPNAPEYGTNLGNKQRTIKCTSNKEFTSTDITPRFWLAEAQRVQYPCDKNRKPAKKTTAKSRFCPAYETDSPERAPATKTYPQGSKGIFTLGTLQP